jgi:hypothetical protein
MANKPNGKTVSLAACLQRSANIAKSSVRTGVSRTRNITSWMSPLQRIRAGFAEERDPGSVLFFAGWHSRFYNRTLRLKRAFEANGRSVAGMNLHLNDCLLVFPTFNARLPWLCPQVTSPLSQSRSRTAHGRTDRSHESQFLRNFSYTFTGECSIVRCHNRSLTKTNGALNLFVLITVIDSRATRSSQSAHVKHIRRGAMMRKMSR